MPGRGRPRKNAEEILDEEILNDTENEEEDDEDGEEELEVKSESTETTAKSEPKEEEQKALIQELSQPDPEPESKPYKTRKQLDRNMLVPVCSFVVGLLYYKSERTGAVYRFTEFGARDDIELFELQSMRSSMPRFLTEPWLIILDDEVAEHLALTDLYEKILKPQSLDKLFKAKSSKMRTILENAPKGMKKVVAARASQLAQAGKFDSMSKRRIIEETCNVDLSE